MQHHILILHPGATSTKVAIATDDAITANETILHDPSTLAQFSSIRDQLPFRTASVTGWISGRLPNCSAVVTVGGLLKPVTGGVYPVNVVMIADARAEGNSAHASSLGCELAAALASKFTCPAYVVDPLSVDEFEPLAYYSGHPLIERRSFSHALIIHTAARRAAQELKLPYNSSAFIVAHLGVGVSVASVLGGKIVDVNDAGGDGPFSPERTGSLPLQQFISLCRSGSYGEDELRNLVMGQGGLTAYLGTGSIREIEERIDGGDAHAAEVFRAMAYQIAKEIGAMATVVQGDVDAIVLTGSAARSAKLRHWIGERVSFIAPMKIFPGEDEIAALAAAALRVLRGEEELKTYE